MKISQHGEYSEAEWCETIGDKVASLPIFFERHSNHMV